MSRKHVYFPPATHNPHIEEVDRWLSSEIFLKSTRSISSLRKPKSWGPEDFFLFSFVLAEEEAVEKGTVGGDGFTEQDLVSELRLGTIGGWLVSLGWWVCSDISNMLSFHCLRKSSFSCKWRGKVETAQAIWSLIKHNCVQVPGGAWVEGRQH